MKTTNFLLAVALVSAAVWASAQTSTPATSGMQMQHSMPAGNAGSSNANSGSGANPKVPAVMDDSNSIFCGSMHTGQLCSMGTSSVLKVAPEKQQEWIAAARKYNKAVEAATQELFKDADATLAPDQAALVKQWFAVGLNPEINRLLYSKGLGAK